MKGFILFTSVCLIITLTQCKKGNSLSTKEADEISFTCNGKDYSFDKLDGGNGVTVYYGIYGTPLIVINLPSEFTGTITYQQTGCAYLLPQNTTIVAQPGCKLFDYSMSSLGGSIDSSKVLLYSSGTLNLVSSNCRTVNVDIFGTGGAPFTYCDVNGTFDLTLQNKNNQKIVIAKGVVKVHDKWMK
jgi:hypothetical protein